MIQKLTKTIKGMYYHWLWDSCLDVGIAEDKYLSGYYGSIGESAIEYLHLPNPVFPPLIYLKLVQLVAKKILVLRAVMGMQPMTTPAGLAFNLQTSQKSDQSMSISIEPSAVLAMSVKISITPKEQVLPRELKNAYLNALASEIAESIIHHAMADFISRVKPPIDTSADPISKDNMIFRVNAAASQIAARTRRGPGNVILVNEESAELLIQCPFFILSKDEDMTELYKLGTIVLSGKASYLVMVSPCVPKNQLIIMYKGDSDFDASFIICPYQLILSGGNTVDAQTLEPALQLITRFGSWHGQEEPAYHQAIKLS